MPYDSAATEDAASAALEAADSAASAALEAAEVAALEAAALELALEPPHPLIMPIARTPTRAIPKTLFAFLLQFSFPFKPKQVF